MLFAPSTVAIAALILSFSILKMDCSEWLHSIPNFFLPLNDNPLLDTSSDTRLFDIDGCLQSFQKIETFFPLSASCAKKDGERPIATPEPLASETGILVSEIVILASDVISNGLISTKSHMSKSRCNSQCNSTVVTPQKDLSTRKRSQSVYNEDKMYPTVGLDTVISPFTDKETPLDSHLHSMKMRKFNEIPPQTRTPFSGVSFEVLPHSIQLC